MFKIVKAIHFKLTLFEILVKCLELFFCNGSVKSYFFFYNTDILCVTWNEKKNINREMFIYIALFLLKTKVISNNILKY